MKQLWIKLNTHLEKIANLTRDAFLLVIRLYWGWQFFLSGKGKLGNLEQTAAFFSELGLPAPKFQAFLAGSTECFGGLLLLIGLGSRLISVPLMFTMIVAYATAHLDALKGIFSDPDTFVTQAPFLFLLASAIIFVFGPGRVSVDHWLNRRTK
jgi:putative oxidoreductase